MANGRQLPVLIGLTQQTDKLEFAEERTAPEQRVIKEPVLLTGVGISIDFQTAFRHTS